MTFGGGDGGTAALQDADDFRKGDVHHQCLCY
jgi:hypothetical protein